MIRRRVAHLLRAAATLLARMPTVASALLAVPKVAPRRSVRARLFEAFSWPLTERLRGRRRVGTVSGAMLVDVQAPIGRVLAVCGEWEPHVTSAFRSCLGPGDVCVDVGAHVGYYTLLASRVVGPAGHVYAFEPVRSVFDLLAANIEANTAANVSAFGVAAGAERGTALLYQAPGPSPTTSSLSARMLDVPHGGRAEEFVAVEVAVAPVEDMVPREAHPLVRVVKVDAEGYEIEVLRGMEAILRAATRLAVFVELSPEWASDDPARFLSALCERHRLAPYRVPNEYSLRGFFPRRIEPPSRIARIPSERCDLVLVRGLEMT